MNASDAGGWYVRPLLSKLLCLLISQYFCLDMEKYEDGALVTGPKLVDFLRKIPLAVGNQNKGPNNGKPVGIASLNNYVAGVVDLYQVF